MNPTWRYDSSSLLLTTLCSPMESKGSSTLYWLLQEGKRWLEPTLRIGHEFRVYFMHECHIVFNILKMNKCISSNICMTVVEEDGMKNSLYLHICWRNKFLVHVYIHTYTHTSFWGDLTAGTNPSWNNLCNFTQKLYNVTNVK